MIFFGHFFLVCEGLTIQKSSGDVIQEEAAKREMEEVEKFQIDKCQGFHEFN